MARVATHLGLFAGTVSAHAAERGAHELRVGLEGVVDEALGDARLRSTSGEVMFVEVDRKAT